MHYVAPGSGIIAAVVILLLTVVPIVLYCAFNWGKGEDA